MTEKIDSPAVPEPALRAAEATWVVLSRLRRKVRELPGEGDLSPSQVSAMARLDKLGPSSASELAAAEGMRPQSMAKIVAALEEAGYVIRRPDPADGRRQVITLTERGRTQRHGDRRARQVLLAQALQAQCTEEQLHTIAEAMALLDEVIAQ
ncbi:MarR family winged helix-turn-helix transcriptional regulator [Streptomyces boninensis]|uniref:MarR family winged helix-turn-helix transcriptional regulator n=1 Tax=Streptomyces boninensis TaxID=2039455 RepID=UPI003B215EE5